MSLSRALFNEFRPFFRLLEDPFFNSPTPYFARQGQLADPFSWQNSRPALNLSEEEDGSYVVEAELPGVKKDNLDVKIGDGGRSLTIEGRVLQRGATQPAPTDQAAPEATTTAAPTGDQSSALTKAEGISILLLGKDQVTDTCCRRKSSRNCQPGTVEQLADVYTYRLAPSSDQRTDREGETGRRNPNHPCRTTEPRIGQCHG